MDLHCFTSQRLEHQCPVIRRTDIRGSETQLIKLIHLLAYTWDYTCTHTHTILMPYDHIGLRNSYMSIYTHPKYYLTFFVLLVRTFHPFQSIFISSSPSEPSYQLPDVGLADTIISIFKMQRQSFSEVKWFAKRFTVNRAAPATQIWNANSILSRPLSEGWNRIWFCFIADT